MLLVGDAAHGQDAALVAASLELLELRRDRPSAGVGRRGLDHEDATVRLAAARLLGRVAGPAVTVQLRNAAALSVWMACDEQAVEYLRRFASTMTRTSGRSQKKR